MTPILNNWTAYGNFGTLYVTGYGAYLEKVGPARVVCFDRFVIKTSCGRNYRLGIPADRFQIKQLRKRLRRFARRKKQRQRYYGRLA